MEIPVKRHRGSRDTHGTHTPHGTHMGRTGAHGHTDHTDEPHNHPNPPTHPSSCASHFLGMLSINAPTHARYRATTETAADSTAAAPEPTAPRGRFRRGRPQRTRPCRHPLPERLPAPARRRYMLRSRLKPLWFMYFDHDFDFYHLVQLCCPVFSS
jgi:hypothetical protein